MAQTPSTRTMHRGHGQGDVPGAVEAATEPPLGHHERRTAGRRNANAGQPVSRGETAALVARQAGDLGPVDLRRRRQDRGAHQVVGLREVRRSQRIGRLALVEVGLLDDAGIERAGPSKACAGAAARRVGPGLLRRSGHVGRGRREVGLVAVLRARPARRPWRNDAAAVVSASDREVSMACAVTMSGSAACHAAAVADCRWVTVSAAQQQAADESEAATRRRAGPPERGRGGAPGQRMCGERVAPARQAALPSPSP